MTYLISGLAVVIIGLFIWGKIQQKKKESAIRARDIAIDNAIALENKLANMKNNVDQVLDYNTKDEQAKKEIDKSIATLKSAKKDKEVIVEYEKIRSRIYDSLATL